MQTLAATVAPAAASPAVVFFCQIGLAAGGGLAYLLFSAAGLVAACAAVAAAGVLVEAWDA